jgi:hypothetical protein
MVQWLKPTDLPKVRLMRNAGKIVLSLFTLAVLNAASADNGKAHASMFR